MVGKYKQKSFFGLLQGIKIPRSSCIIGKAPFRMLIVNCLLLLITLLSLLHSTSKLILDLHAILIRQSSNFGNQVFRKLSQVRLELVCQVVCKFSLCLRMHLLPYTISFQLLRANTLRRSTSPNRWARSLTVVSYCFSTSSREIFGMLSSDSISWCSSFSSALSVNSCSTFD